MPKMKRSKPHQDPDTLLRVLMALFKAAREGGAGFKGSERLASDSLRRSGGDVEGAIRRLIRREVAKTASVGFVTGIGGVVTMPVALPADIVGAGVIQMRMVQAIAILRDWDLDEPEVESLVLAATIGAAAVDALLAKGLAKLTPQAAQKILLRSLARAGAKVVPQIPARVIPLVGGVAGAAVNAGFARSIAALAQRTFREGPPPEVG